MVKKKEKDFRFEEALNRLESIVEKLEGGSLSLEESLNLFEEGIKLAGICRTKLREAELKIKTLTPEGFDDIKLNELRFSRGGQKEESSEGYPQDPGDLGEGEE